jgi:MFS family permease
MDTSGDRMGRRLGGLLFVLLTAQFMSNVDVSVVNVASPAIQKHLGASGAQMQFIVSGYILTFAVLLVTGARLGDLRGYRRTFLGGLVVFTLASLACALAPSAGLLIAFRIIQAAAGAVMMPQVMTGIQLNFTGKVRVKAFAYYALSLSLGAVAGQVLGGVLLSANLFGESWRPLFMINVPIGILLLAMGVRLLPRDQPRTENAKRLDLAGVGLLLASLLLLTVPLVMGREIGWPVWVWLAMAGGVVVLALFVAFESRMKANGGYPLLNMQLFRWPRIAWGLLAQFAVQGTYYAVLFTIALYLQQGLGHSATYSGLALLPWVITFGIVGFAVRKLPQKVMRFIPGSGYLWLAIVYAALSLVVGTGNHNGPLLLTLLGLGGIGLGAGFNSILGHLTSSIPGRYAPDFSGAHSTILQISGTLGSAVFGAVYLTAAPHGGIGPASHGFSTVCAGLAALACVAGISAFMSTHSPVVTDPTAAQGPGPLPAPASAPAPAPAKAPAKKYVG